MKLGTDNNILRAQGVVARRRRCEPNNNFLTDDIYRSCFDCRPCEYRVIPGAYRYVDGYTVLQAVDTLNRNNVNLFFYENESECWRDYVAAQLSTKPDHCLNYGKGGVLVKTRLDV